MNYQRHRVDYQWRAGSRFWAVTFPTLEDAEEFYHMRILAYPDLEVTRPYPCDNKGCSIQPQKTHC
jgi:hypothetical protein